MKYILFTVPLVFVLVLACSLIGLFRWHKAAVEALHKAREWNDAEGARNARADLFAIRLSAVIIVLFVGALVVLAVETIIELP